MRLLSCRCLLVWSIVFVAGSACGAQSPAPGAWPHIRIDRDNIEIRVSSIVDHGYYRIVDADGNGVLHIVGDNVTLEFAPGAILDGSRPGQAPDTYTGIGIRADGVDYPIIRGANLRGFKVGIHARETPGLILEDLDIRDTYRQHLGSTPKSEDGSDWLWPHRNDNNEWMTNYGAAIYIQDSLGVEVRRTTVRASQNGIVLDRVTLAKIYDNDCSFLSGWGLALWRSGGNVITRNAFDFCVRGYSHGVYNRGQDSAGILLFEQCSENVIAENSVTHGGDGFFCFAGREALGEEPPPQEDFVYTRRGNNANLLVKNDFSYAAAHGVEVTFSFDNRIYANRMVENAICGIWGGYSQDTHIAGNTFAGNGQMAYGMERGGINIEHGRGNRIEWNTFYENKCGIYLWWDNDVNLLQSPWGRANEKGSDDNLIAHNRFSGDTIAVQLRATTGTGLAENWMDNVDTEVDADQQSPTEEVIVPAVMFTLPDYPVFGSLTPVGARDDLRGRDKIIMTEWGPWDHESPLLRSLGREGGGGREHSYELLTAGPIDYVEFRNPTRDSFDDLGWRITLGEHSDAGQRVTITCPEASGVYSYNLRLRAGEVVKDIAGTIIRASWDVRFFAWSKGTNDPRTDLDAWYRDSRGPSAVAATLTALDFNYGWGGPSQIQSAAGNVAEAGLAGNFFGMIATTTIPLTAGRWRITTLSDDGVRVSVQGDRVIDNWTWHGPTRDSGEFTLDRDQEVEISVEHFEIDGFAQLEFNLSPIED